MELLPDDFLEAAKVDPNADGYVGAWVDADGRIKTEFKGSRGTEVYQNRTGLELVAGSHDAATEYFVGPVGERTKAVRPLALDETAFDLVADGVSVLTIAVPVDTQVRNAENTIIGAAEDGLFEFVTSIPATYTFEVRPPFPYQRQTITVTVHAL